MLTDDELYEIWNGIEAPNVISHSRAVIAAYEAKLREQGANEMSMNLEEALKGQQ